MEKRLGKGLEALMPEISEGKTKEKVEKVRLTEIVPNPFQPRKTFNIDKMEDLVSSIREKGVIQPVLVRRNQGKYEIIAGERRFRAAQQLQYEEIPAIVKENIDDAASLEISIIENIQRDELNPIEEANAYKELIGKFEYTLEKVGQMVGKGKTTISNSLRLLSLSDEIKNYLEQGEITTGHAKVLLSIQNERKRERITKTIMEHSLSVRQTEIIAHETKEMRRKPRKDKDPDVLRVEEELQHKLGTKVNILQGKKRGRIEIQFFSNEDFDRILKIILSS
jgi:ParB family chromosome partitioning protein